MADVLDIFGDGSCLDLITLNGNVDTVNNGSMTIVGGPATYAPGRYGQAFVSTTNTSCVMGSPRIMPNTFTSAGSISFFVKPTATPSYDVIPFMYTEAFFGSINLAFATSTNDYILSGVRFVNGFALNLNEWHHICYVCDTVLDTDTVYVNGVIFESVPRNDRFDYEMDSMWIGGDNFNATEFRGDHNLDQFRFFDRAITATEVGILNSEPEFGEVFRDRRSVFGDHHLSFLDKRENLAAAGFSSFKDRRVSMSGTNESFKDRREVVTIENRSTFLDRRVCTSNINIVGFLDKREVQVLHLKSFKDRRETDASHFINFLDTRDIHKGGGIVFSDKRYTQRDLRYSFLRDTREVETIPKGIVIERINI